MVMVATLCCGALALMGAVPLQDERPPQPVFPEFISGTVTVQGSPAPAGALLIACIDDCETVYQSEPKTLAEGGRFERLELDPGDDSLINRDVNFYLVNEFGRIRAQEVHPFIGVLGRYWVNLTFLNPLPAPTAPPAVPNAHGDPNADGHPGADAYPGAHRYPGTDIDADAHFGADGHGGDPAHAYGPANSRPPCCPPPATRQ